MIAFDEPIHRHSFIPCARWPQLGVCGWYGCKAFGRWSTVLGCYVHIIPWSHQEDANPRYKAGGKSKGLHHE